jgi:hypothetical protein
MGSAYTPSRTPVLGKKPAKSAAWPLLRALAQTNGNDITIAGHAFGASLNQYDFMCIKTISSANLPINLKCEMS